MTSSGVAHAGSDGSLFCASAAAGSVGSSGLPSPVRRAVAEQAFVIHHGHVLDVLRTMADESVQCCVTAQPQPHKGALTP